MAKSPNPAELNLEQYLPARKPVVQEKLTGLLNTEMPTVGQLLGLMLGEDLALLKLAQTDTTGKINLLSADAENIAGQITNTDADFRDKITKPNIAPETILAETASYRNSLTQLETQRLKISEALEDLDFQAQQLKNAKTHSGKLEAGFTSVIERYGDRPIPPTFLAAMFSSTMPVIAESPTTIKSNALQANNLDQIVDDATTKMASLFTRPDEPINNQIVARLQERRKYQTLTMPEDVDLNALLVKRGIDLSTLEKTSGKPMLKAHVIRTMPRFLATELRLELNEETVDHALDLMAQGAVTGEDLKDRESLIILVNALKATVPAPVEITIAEEPIFQVAKPEEVAPVTKMAGRDARPFDLKPLKKETQTLDLAVLTDALTFDRNGVWKTRDIVSFAEQATGQRLSKEMGAPGNKAKKRRGVFDDVQDDFSNTVLEVANIARKLGVSTIQELLESRTVEIPETQKGKLKPFGQIPIEKLPGILDAMKMHGGISNKFKPTDLRSLIDFLQTKKG